MEYVYAIYNTKTKSFIRSTGYYGTENNVQAFADKVTCEKHIVTYYSSDYRPKKLKVK